MAWVYRSFNTRGSIPSLYFRDAQRLAHDEDVTLICAASTREAAEAPVRFETVEAITRGNGRLRYAAECLSFARRASRTLASLADRFDVVHVEGTAALRGDIVRVHAVRPAEIEHYFRIVETGSRIRRWTAPYVRPHGAVVMSIEKRLYRGPDPPLCIAPSVRVKSDLQRHYDVPPDLIEVIPYGIETKLLRYDERTRNACRDRLGAPRDRLVSLVVATSFRRKGVARALAGFASSGVDGELWILGGDDPEPYRREAARAGIGDRVRFLGPQPLETLPQWYSASDVVIAASDQDSWALPVVEALAAGRVVIASEYTGSHEAIDHGRTGFVVGGRGAPQEIAAVLKALEADPEHRAAVMAAAAAAGRDFDVEALFPRYRAAIHRASELRTRRSVA